MVVPSSRHVSIFGERWDLHHGGECTCGDASPFVNESSALHWLRSFKSDCCAMYSLRSLAAQRTPSLPAWRYDDESVLKLIAPLLSSGNLHAHHILRPISHGRNLQDVAAPAPRASTPARPSRSVDSLAPAAPRPESPEPETFSAATDAQATAAALQQASQSGAPFCDECARAAPR